MSSPLSALRRPRPLSLQGSKKPLPFNSGIVHNATSDAIHSSHHASHSVRWASLLPCTIQDTTPPLPPLTLEQVQAMQQLRKDQLSHQEQRQLEHSQRLRQQRELQSLLAKDRSLLEQQRVINASSLRRSHSIGSREELAAAFGHTSLSSGSTTSEIHSSRVRRELRRPQSMFGSRGITPRKREGGGGSGGNGGSDQKMSLMTLATSGLSFSSSGGAGGPPVLSPIRLSQSLLMTTKELCFWDSLQPTAELVELGVVTTNDALDPRTTTLRQL